MGEGGRWSPIESDPAVFTELIRGFGATGVEVEELWTLGADAFERLEPIHGFVFLYKWGADVGGGGGGGGGGDAGAGADDADAHPDVFFARQVTENACATQAVVNVLLNVRHEHVRLGAALTELREFCRPLDAQSRGLAIANSAPVRQAHEAFARNSAPFECDGFGSRGAADADGDSAAFHFVGFAPVDGRVYELDGLKRAPVDLGAPRADETWLDVFRRAVRERIARHRDGEIRFNLMALVSERRALLEKERAAAVRAGGPRLDERLAEIDARLEADAAERKRRRAEIARRRHNYLAFIVELLKILAREGKLMPLYEAARRKARRQPA